MLKLFAAILFIGASLTGIVLFNADSERLSDTTLVVFNKNGEIGMIVHLSPGEDVDDLAWYLEGGATVKLDTADYSAYRDDLELSQAFVEQIAEVNPSVANAIQASIDAKLAEIEAQEVSPE